MEKLKSPNHFVTGNKIIHIKPLTLLEQVNPHYMYNASNDIA